MVLLADDTQPLFRWILGRSIVLHPGGDHVIRVVSVKTANGVQCALKLFFFD